MNFNISKTAVLILSSLILSGGCSRQVRITDDIRLCDGRSDRLNLVVDGELRCSNINDVWLDNACLYGWFYSEGNYTMFLFDILTRKILTGDNARRKISELQLPVDQWTNHAEIFNEFVTDHERRSRFF